MTTRDPILVVLLVLLLDGSGVARDSDRDAQDHPQAAEARRIEAIGRAGRSVVCLFDPTGTSGGSGVIVSPDGLGITNYHVVADLLPARKGTAGLPDGRKYPLEVLGIDPTGDLAMFRVSGRDAFDAAPLGDSNVVRVGDPVFAAGNPFMLAEDFSPTVTAGIISGTGRYQVGADDRTLVYTDCIQVDASINPGNSGGPLFDAAGRVIGINGRASFERRGRVNVGLGYAISINQIKRFIPGLRQGLLVEHGSPGATVVDAGFGRVVFERVEERGPVAKAGVRSGDRLVSLDGRAIDSANGFLNAIGTYPAGWPVRMVWEHDGQQISRTIELDRLPAKLPPRLASAFKTDEIVTRAAAEAAASQPVEPMPPGNESSSSIARVQAATVQLYGAAIGRESGYATGVIVSPDGYVLTVVSLVLEARRLRAVTSDGRVWRCEVVHRDERRQLALLKLAAYPENVDTAASLRDQTAPARWEPPQLPDEAAGQTGDAILVIGNPFKVAQGAESLSVMRGIVAGRCTLDATAGTQEVAYRGEVLLLDVVTSNPGSAGSPVVDLAGRWVGLVGEIVTSRLTNTHLNYAYPAAEIRVFLDEARPTSTSTAPAGRLEEVFAGPGYHGVRLSRFAYRRALPFVRSVVAGSPAAKAGLKSDDLIISANGVAIAQSSVFEELCERLRAGDELSLTVKRGDVLLPVRFTLTEMPK